MKRIAILGSTGSIGTQALDVVRQHDDLFKVTVISANTSVDALISQALEFKPEYAVICSERHFPVLRDALEGSPTKALCGTDELCGLMALPEIDIVLASMVGFSGLKPTIAAIKAGKDIALANKETLVAGGALVMTAVKEYGVRLLPVDSEHSAIFQCLQGAGGNKIRKIHLTASGGPFRNWKREDMAKATKKDALAHPNWVMGNKITIDSATMMNKGFEVIEAKWLFDIAPEDINVVVHPESVIHSMIEFEDGAVLAQMGSPDMREPIQYAFSYPSRLSLNNRKLDFATLSALHFSKPDLEKFPCLRLAFEAIERGGNAPCALNAANEVAVAAFLQDKLGYFDMARIAESALQKLDFIKEPTLEDIFETDYALRKYAEELI